jgi:hypothetical protein
MTANTLILELHFFCSIECETILKKSLPVQIWRGSCPKALLRNYKLHFVHKPNSCSKFSFIRVFGGLQEGKATHTKAERPQIPNERSEKLLHALMMARILL